MNGIIITGIHLYRVGERVLPTPISMNDGVGLL